MTSNSNYLVGQVFGRLSILAYSHTVPKTGTYWLAKCSCYNFTCRSSKAIKAPVVASCGCYRIETLVNRNKTRVYTCKPDARYNRILSCYKFGAKKRKIKFRLTLEDIKNLIDKSCFYCGVPPANTFTYKSKFRQTSFQYNGIDRIDSGGAYETTNCVPCCGDCNTAKNDLTQSQFIALCKRVASNH